MRPFVAAILLAASSCYADAIYKGPAGYVRLSNISCTHSAIILDIKPEWVEKFKQGWMVNHGKEYALCWIVDGDHVFVVIEDGQSGRLPIAKFKPEVGV